MLKWLSTAVRKAEQFGLRHYLNHSYARYGKVTELKIDPDAGRISATLMLKGESAPIHVQAAYLLPEDSGAVTLTDVSVSREWMHVLAQDLVKGKAIPLPEKYVRMLKMVL